MNVQSLREHKAVTVLITFLLGPLGLLIFISSTLRQEKYIKSTVIAWCIIAVLSAAPGFRDFGLFAFNYLDSLFYMGSNTTGWFVWGAFLGIVFGAVTAYKKYNLGLKVIVVPIFMLVVLTVLMAVFNEPGKNTFSNSPYSQNESTEPLTQNAYNFVNVTANNNLQSFKGISYNAANLIDGNTTSAWITSPSSTNNNRIEFTFNIPTDITKMTVTGLYIVNGYRKSYKTWKNYNKISSLSIYHNGEYIGIKSVGNNFDNSENIEVIPFEVKNRDRVSVSMNSFYSGQKYRKQVAISELVPIVVIKRD